MPAGCLALLAAAAAACSPSDEKKAAAKAPELARSGPAAGEPELEEDEREELLEELLGLSYVGWDTGADPRLSGVTLHDEARAWPGYNIYALGGGTVDLLDMEGRRVHSWRVSETKRRCPYAELLADGTLGVVCRDASLIRVDWASKILWKLELRTHHDLFERPDGSLLIPYKESASLEGREVRFDGIAFVSPRGEITSQWYTFDHLDQLRRHHLPSPLDQAPKRGAKAGRKPSDYYHLNSVEELPETELGQRDTRFRRGNILICLRNVNLIAVLDGQDRSVLWSWGSRELEGPHMPTMLENGHILLFDNGVQRKYSRVIEMDPVEERIVWEYRGSPPESFYSQLRGSNQRLENGNTLICEADRGHVFEVTPEGEKVWEFWNPLIEGTKRRWIYRFMRVPAERVDSLLEASGRLLEPRPRGG